MTTDHPPHTSTATNAAQPLPGAVTYLPTGFPDVHQHTAPATPARSNAALPAILQRTITPRRAATQGPRRRHRPHRPILIAAAAGVLLLLTTVIIVTAATATTPATVQVRALFTALAERNPEGLAGLHVCGDSPLCTPGALSRGYEPPQHLQIISTDRPANDDLVITVHYDIGSTGHTDHIGFTRYPHGVIGHEWRITTPPGATLQLHSTYWDTAHLAALDIPTDTTTSNGDRQQSPPWIPPGQYTLTTTGDQLVDPIRTDLTIAGDHNPAPTTLTPTIRADLTQKVNQQIHDRIDQCAAQNELRPAIGSLLDSIHSCPFNYDSPYPGVDSPMWTIDRYPSIALNLGGDRAIIVTTTAPGQATLTYRWTLDFVAPQRWTTETATTPITIGGQVTIDQGAPSWHP